jgi:hypothetical protein
MGGAIPPLPQTPSWRGALLKHRDNFTFYLYYIIIIIIIIIIIDYGLHGRGLIPGTVKDISHHQ